MSSTLVRTPSAAASLVPSLVDVPIDVQVGAPPLTLSPAAARRIRAIGEGEGRAVMLRLAVEGGGCSGFQYLFDLVEAAEPDDHRIERDGATALVDDISVALLKGSEIDFVDELAGAEFRVRNPNAKSSCGCGVSFSI